MPKKPSAYLKMLMLEPSFEAAYNCDMKSKIHSSVVPLAAAFSYAAAIIVVPLLGFDFASYS